MADLLNAALNAASSDKLVFSPLSKMVEQAQQRVNSEWQEFEREREKTEEWKAEQRRLQEKRDNEQLAVEQSNASERTVLTRQLFSIEDDADDETEPSASTALAQPAAAPSCAAVAAAEITTPEPWRLRLDALLTILRKEASAAAMPREQLLAQLQELGQEIAAASSLRSSEGAAPSTHHANGAAETADATTRALRRQVEDLSEALAKAQLDARQKAEASRRKVEALESRVEAAEAETLDRMRIVAESVQAETDAGARVARVEEELAAVRSKAGARMKELIASNKALEEEVARLREIEELNRSKMAALEASLAAADADHNRSARAKAAAEAKQQEGLAYARALVLRYLELEDQHEMLFPALASAFRFTQQEVQRIQLAQQQHAHRTSLWGRALGAGSRVLSVAKEVAQEARRTT